MLFDDLDRIVPRLRDDGAIYLSQAQITTLKGLNWVFDPRNITILWLDENPLISLAGVQLMTNLVELNIDYCNLHSLAPLRHLTALRKLSADGNRITSLEPLAGLVALEYLDISFNCLLSLDYVD